MSNSVTRGQIAAVVWRACDTFRGVIDAAQYKDYILVMLFLKYLSDLWSDRKEQYEKKYKGDKVRVERAMSRERFVLPAETHFDYLYSKRNEANIGDIINIGLTAIEDANRGKLENVFRNIDFNSEANLGKPKDRNHRLKNLLEDFRSLDLRPSRVGDADVIGDAYETLIEWFAAGAGKKAGEFYTPPQVSTLLTRLLQPKPGDRICDPACGSGSLLIKMGRYVKQRHNSNDFALYGQEANGSTWALCKMNLFLHEADQATIEWCDTIKSPALIEKDSLMRFDVVVANPPFSLEKWGDPEKVGEDKPFNRFHRGVPPKSKGDYAFISHMVETALPDVGKVGVIVPHGVLFRGGKEGVIRRKLIEENMLHAVVGLPPNLFYGTGIPAAILVFDKGRTDRGERDILFIDASREFAGDKKQNRLRDEDIEKISLTFGHFTTVDKYAYRATPEEIKANEYNLNIPRYVDTFEPEAEVNIEATQREIVSLEKQLAVVRAEMAAYMEELGI